MRPADSLVAGAPRLPAAGLGHDVARTMEFYRAGRKGGSFESGIELALQRILASPKFVLRVERDPATVSAGTAYRISDVELATRLSFFLWSSIPDDQLLTLATRDQLRNPQVLEQQVRRMLRDPRATALVDNFAGQWLQLRNLQRATPDNDLFPEFDDNLRQSFRREVELLFGSHHARGPQRARSADGRLHLRRRAAGQALRHAECLRQRLPAGAGDRRGAQGAARQGRGPRHHLERRSHLAGRARQVDPRQPAGHAAAGAPGGRATALRLGRHRRPAIDARSRWLSIAPTRCAPAATS